MTSQSDETITQMNAKVESTYFLFTYTVLRGKSYKLGCN